MKRERKKTKDKKSNNDSPRMLDDEEQLRLQNQLRKAAKMSKQLEALYQDSDEEGFSLLKYPVRECKLSIPGMQGEIAINPVVTLIAVVCLWAIVIWCKGKKTKGDE